MFHVRQGRGKFVPGVHRADARGRGAPQGPRRAGTETVLLPSDDPLPCGTHRRSVAVRLKDLAPRRRTRGEGFLGLQSFERFRWVRGVAWFERGGRLVFPLTRNPTSLGCWRLRFKSGRTHIHGGTEYRFPRGGLGSCPACRANWPGPFPIPEPSEPPYAPVCSDYVLTPRSPPKPARRGRALSLFTTAPQTRLSDGGESHVVVRRHRSDPRL